MRGSLETLELGFQIPWHFRCPISLELMRDPVTVSTGQTYDRNSIESWVASGNTTCPVTRSLLSDYNFIPNHTLRRLIQDWCVANGSSGVERIPTPKQPVDAALVRSLLNRASSESASCPARLSALRRIKALALDSDRNRTTIASIDAKDVLLSVVFNSIHDSDTNELSLESLAVVIMFEFSESECASVGSDYGKMNFLTSLLFHTSIEVRVNSASLIEIVTSGTRSPEIRTQISNTEGIFAGIVQILRCPTAYPVALKVGVKALFSLSLAKQSRHRAVAAGAAEVLVERFSDCDAERALAIVELLCRSPEGCAAFESHALTVPLLVKTLLKVSDKATEYATGALLALCSESRRSRSEAVAAGIVIQLLVLMQSECTDRAKRKAQMLLKQLRDSWPEESIAEWDDFTSGHVLPS